MDVVLFVTCITLLGLLLAHELAFNGSVARRRRTRDIRRLFDRLSRRDPTTISFCLGRDAVTGLYRNVVLTGQREDGSFDVETRLNPHPVNRRGEFVAQFDHGALGERKDGRGYTVTGMELVSFVCPDGYEGPECRAEPLCRDDEYDRLKPLTYSRFNDLGLHASMSGVDATRVRSRRDAPEAMHPRIRVHCLRNGRYELQTCPDNKLLDPETLRCRVYDVCQDRPDGYRHRFPTTDDDLSIATDDRLYYVCKGNRSERRTCPDDTVYSASQARCISTNQCYDKGDATIAIDERSYVACSNDTGRVVRCDEYVVVRNGVHSCHVSTCKPETYVQETAHLRYEIGRLECTANDEPVIRRCNEGTSASRYEYRWLDASVAYEVAWPLEIYDPKTNKCRANPSDADVEWYNETIELAWTSAMRDAHRYNVRRHEYECKEGEYRRDYATERVFPEPPDGTFVDPGAPCRAVATPWHAYPWRFACDRDTCRVYPSDSLDATKTPRQPPMLIGVPAPEDTWPTYVDQRFSWISYRYDGDDDRVIVRGETRDSIQPPVGFYADSTRNVTLLQGFGPRPDDEPRPMQWYTLASGAFAALATTTDTARYECPSRLSLAAPGTYGVCWRAVVESTDRRFESPQLGATFDAKGLRRDDDEWPRGFLLLTVKTQPQSDGGGGNGDDDDVGTLPLRRTAAVYIGDRALTKDLDEATLVELP